jgi:hypothetical protein
MCIYRTAKSYQKRSLYRVIANDVNDYINVLVRKEFIYSFSCSSQLEQREGPFGGFCDHAHTVRHTVGLLWTSDQPIIETCTYTGQHNI